MELNKKLLWVFQPFSTVIAKVAGVKVNLREDCNFKIHALELHILDTRA